MPGGGYSNADIALGTAEILFRAEQSSEHVEIENTYVREARKTVRNRKAKDVFKIIKELDPQTVVDQILFTEIQAPPFKEEKRANKLAEMIASVGADPVWADNVGKVIAQRNGLSGNRTVVD